MWRRAGPGREAEFRCTALRHRVTSRGEPGGELVAKHGPVTAANSGYLCLTQRDHMGYSWFRF